ncbi:mechanosensitive ion channel family protein [Methanobacterium alcaliphilum]|uniref:mechanosensitive ion channel family protein n=1 Tax=Methanobacterium alcaliphilum TaxID=392018 RepID=UPI00200AA9A7|nr:mechanosensitive ion channel family protein [Methanobacterium alcaliphilum]MCK9151221.1 mechanosensitive ion channel family protein [Methanobacterium alcaliphilum]
MSLNLISNPLIKNLLLIATTFLVAIIIIKWANYFIKKMGQRWEIDLTVIQVLNDLVKYGIYIIALVISLKELGIDITAIALSLGIVGVAVGFAARDTLSNFISGMFILADKSFKVGDTIEISNQKGKVTKVGFRTTTLTTPDNSVITVPNSTFSKNPYLNYTYMDRRRVDLRVNIPYDFELEELTEKIETLVNNFDWVRKEPKPKILILELKDVGVQAKITAWTDDPWEVAQYKTLMAEKIKKILVIDNE